MEGHGVDCSVIGAHMIETLGTILGGMLAIMATGAVLVGYVLWSRKRRHDAAFAEAAAQARQGNGGGGGPNEPA